MRARGQVALGLRTVSRLSRHLLLFFGIWVLWIANNPRYDRMQLLHRLVGTFETNVGPGICCWLSDVVRRVRQYSCVVVTFTIVVMIFAKATCHLQTDPEVLLLGLTRHYAPLIRPYHDVISLAYSNQQPVRGVIVNGYKVIACDSEVVPVDRKDESGVKGGVDQTQQISLGSLVKFRLVELQLIRLLNPGGVRKPELPHITTAIEQESFVCGCSWGCGLESTVTVSPDIAKG